MPTPATIQEGATGATVRWLQYLLVRRTLSFTDIDGVFGPKTKHGVEEFQQSAHLTVDGIFGPHTATAVKGAQHEAGITADGIVGLQTWALPVHAAGEVIAAGL
jgi:peptidoglycan hydrolase-like protein with peptidoglycan-binding domain